MIRLILSFLALLLVGAPALAQDIEATGLYARLSAGAAVNDHNSRVFGDYVSDMQVSGLNLDGAVGYDFGSVRTELQGQYSRIKADKQGCFTCGSNGKFAYDDSDPTGSAKSYSAFANVLYDFPSIGEFLQISAGAGAGYSKVKIATESDGFIPTMRGSADKLAVQGIVEARAWLTNRTAVTYRFSYQHMGKVGAVALKQGTSKTWAQHNYTLGLTHIF